jgi:DNA-binding NtrC family response regulator
MANEINYNLNDVIYKHVIAALDAYNGNRTHTAEALGVSIKWVFRFIKDNKLEKKYKSKFGHKASPKR